MPLPVTGRGQGGWVKIFIFQKNFFIFLPTCIYGRDKLRRYRSLDSLKAGGSKFLFSKIFIFLPTYIRGDKLPRHPSLDSLKPAGARETYPHPVCMYGGGVTRLAVTGRSTLSSRRGLERPTPALCVCMAGGSLDWPLPVARLSQAGCGS